MADEQWVPFSKRGDAVAAAEFLEFIPGLDGRRKIHIIEWLLKRGEVTDAYHKQEFDLQLRFMDSVSPNWPGGRTVEATAHEWRDGLMEFDTEALLDFFDYALGEIRVDTPLKSSVIDIDRKLLNAHSIYGVGEIDDCYRLIERVDPAVQAAVKEVVETSGTAGQLLGRAWGKVYGRHKDAPGAYSNAIKAVETLACPFILPTNPKATLGTAIKALDDQHNKSTKSTWEFAIENPSDATESVNAVISMMKLLWHGQTDRHGSAPAVFQDATIDQARAAVLLAATLVGWLNDGYLEKK